MISRRGNSILTSGPENGGKLREEISNLDKTVFIPHQALFPPKSL